MFKNTAYINSSKLFCDQYTFSFDENERPRHLKHFPIKKYTLTENNAKNYHIFQIKNNPSISNKITPNPTKYKTTIIEQREDLDDNTMRNRNINTQRHRHAFSFSEKKKKAVHNKINTIYLNKNNNNKISDDMNINKEHYNNLFINFKDQLKNSIRIREIYKNNTKHCLKKQNDIKESNLEKMKIRSYSQQKAFNSCDSISLSQNFLNQPKTKSSIKKKNHLNYTLSDLHVKDKITLSSRLKAINPNKISPSSYKYPVISAIKRKVFSSSQIIEEIHSINNNKENKNHNLYNNKSSTNFTPKSTNKSAKIIIENIEKKFAKTNFKKESQEYLNSSNSVNIKISSSYCVFTLIIISNWGNKEKVGITEIHLLNNKGRNIPIAECHVFNGSEDNIGRIHNNKYHTVNDNDMWTSPLSKGLKIEMFILNPNKANEVDSIQIWNYNGKNLNKGIKNIEIWKKNSLSWKGVIGKGCFNSKSDYSCRIKLNNDFESVGNISDRYISKFATFSSNHRNFFLSLSKLNDPSQISMSLSNHTRGKNSQNISGKSFDTESSNTSRILSIEEINNNIIPFNNSQCLSNAKEVNYITFRKITIQFISNYGNLNYIGLSGLNFIDKDGNLINIETAFAIGALPKDVRTVLEDQNDDRIFENVFNGENSTIDESNMWLTVIHPHYPYIEIAFENEMTLSRIDIWNYNSPFSLDKCAKEIQVIFDNKIDQSYYILLWKNLGLRDINYCQEVKFPQTINDILETKEQLKKNYSLSTLNSPREKVNVNNSNNSNSNSNNNNNNYYNNSSFEHVPFLRFPCGFVFKIILISNYGSNDFISLKGIEFYDIKNININSYEKPIIITETENQRVDNNETQYIYNQVFYNFRKNEDSLCNNFLFICFGSPIAVSYVKLYNSNENEGENTSNVKRFQIYCDEQLLFEGQMNQYGESIIMFNKLKDVNFDSKLIINYKGENEKNLYKEKMEKNGTFVLTLEE